jgi:hypothetical protein
MQVARQLLSLSYRNLQDADAYVALMEIRRSLVPVVSQQPVPGTIGPENVGSWHLGCVAASPATVVRCCG